MLTHFILFQLVLYVFLYPGRIFSNRINVIPSTPKFPVTVFELQIPKLLIKHQAALSLQVSVQEDFQQAFSWMDIKNEQQCIWVWNTMKDKGVSPPINPLNNFQRWHFICATFDLWQGWTNEQLDELTRGHKKISPQRLELKSSLCPPGKHKAVLMDELEKAWALKLFRKKKKERQADLKLPAKIKNKLTKLSEIYEVSELDMMISLIESEYVRNEL